MRRIVRHVSQMSLRSLRTRARRRGLRPALEFMEVRALLSTFTVTTTADNGDNTNPVSGSLRQAILENNADTGNPAADTVGFNIPGSGVQVIQPLLDLPTVTHPLVIDGYSQPGSSPNSLAEGDNTVLQIELDGSQDTSTGGDSSAPYDLLPYNSKGLELSPTGG